MIMTRTAQHSLLNVFKKRKVHFIINELELQEGTSSLEDHDITTYSAISAETLSHFNTRSTQNSGFAH